MARNYKRDRIGRFAKVAGSPGARKSKAKVPARKSPKPQRTRAQQIARKEKIKKGIVIGAQVALVGIAIAAEVQKSRNRNAPSLEPRITAHTKTPDFSGLNIPKMRPMPTVPRRHTVPPQAPKVSAPKFATQGEKVAAIHNAFRPSFEDYANASAAIQRHSARYNSPNPKVALEYATSAQYMKDLDIIAKMEGHLSTFISSSKKK